MRCGCSRTNTPTAALRPCSLYSSCSRSRSVGVQRDPKAVPDSWLRPAPASRLRAMSVVAGERALGGRGLGGRCGAGLGGLGCLAGLGLRALLRHPGARHVGPVARPTCVRRFVVCPQATWCRSARSRRSGPSSLLPWLFLPALPSGPPRWRVSGCQGELRSWPPHEIAGATPTGSALRTSSAPWKSTERTPVTHLGQASARGCQGPCPRG